MLQAVVRSIKMRSQFSLFLLIFLLIAGSVFCGNCNGQDLDNMSSKELKNFFAKQRENYLLVAEHIYNGENPSHPLLAAGIDESPIRGSANKLINTCFKLSSLSLEMVRQIKVGNFEDFQKNYLPKVLKRYNKLSTKLSPQRDSYFSSLIQVEKMLDLSLSEGQLKTYGGFLLLGYSLTTFLFSSLYSGEYSALDYYWRGIIGGIGLCFLYSGLRDIYFCKKMTYSVKKALRDTDVIWALTNTSSFDIRPMYRSCNLF
ncbi:MAG: hypothetical protein K0M45_01830 [Candidatus Paracaedibacteraceae bacterium]|nr:hypothetical protein [Candidatus Paracaedibacteraceae bacterium]